MTEPSEAIRERLRELERAFSAFEKGQRARLYESREALLGLGEAVEASGQSVLTPICEIANRLLGVALMEGGLDEARSVQFVRELLAVVEAQTSMDGGEDQTPGGVFHVVNSEKVGEMLVRRGLLAPDQLEKALLLQRVSKGRRFGQVLIAMNAIDQRTLDSVLEEQRSETRRDETRRAGGGAAQGTPSTLGQPSLRLAPLPPLPPDTSGGGVSGQR